MTCVLYLVEIVIKIHGAKGRRGSVCESDFLSALKLQTEIVENINGPAQGCNQYWGRAVSISFSNYPPRQMHNNQPNWLKQ